MIERKTLWISWLLIAAMTVAGIWRLSLLSDWHRLPLDGPDDNHTINSLIIFWGPFSLLLTMAFLYGRKWFVSGPDDSMRQWRRWSTLFLIPLAIISILGQAFVTARSLGFAPVERVAFARFTFIATGLLIMLLGNALPKMPWLAVRFRPFQLDPWQWNRQLRFAGKLLVGMGLFLTIVMPLLVPSKMVLPAMLGVWLVAMAASLWHRAKVKREPSPLS
jgi:hypothetical protein